MRRLGFNDILVMCGRGARLLAACLLVAGCSSLPVRDRDAPTAAITDFESTALYRMSATQIPADGRSGFSILPVASYAFATRVAMARHAQRSLDVQYYLLKDDRTGHALMRELRDAARRGVRVRLLVDDLYSVGEDQILSDLAALPNIEVRLFNPFINARASNLSRVVGAAFELGRVDRRMHNKLIVADNAAAVIGGRNIADEYFMRAARANFIDMDVFVVGPAVREMSANFDRYWNSAVVESIHRLVGPAPDVDHAAADFERRSADAAAPPLDDLPAEFARFGTLPAAIEAGHIEGLVFAQCTVLADQPDKSKSRESEDFPTVTRAVLKFLGEARREVVITSPYFIPGENGMAMMRRATAAGGRIQLVTNSLASTDEPAAEAAYIRYRHAMLEAHVEIHEISPSLTRERRRLGPFGSSSGALHAKVIMIDHERVFIGSMNLDFRSAYENTEDGVVIESPEISNQVVQLLDVGSFYQLRLGDDGETEWTVRDDPLHRVWHHDPETSWIQRVSAELIEPILPEDEL